MEDARSQSMSGPWAAFFGRSAAPSVAALRLYPGILALETAEGVWLRCDAMTRETVAATARLAPDLQCRVLPDGQIIPHGRLVPMGYLPKGDWLPIAELARVECPGIVRACGRPANVRLKLVRSEEMREPVALLAVFADFAAYAEEAPAIRLERLAFATDAAGRVMVRGMPLPPIRGASFHDDSGILVPCGWRWEPALPGVIVRQTLGLQDGELALVSEDGGVETLRDEWFVQATRPNVRQTSAGAV